LRWGESELVKEGEEEGEDEEVEEEEEVEENAPDRFDLNRPSATILKVAV